MLTIELHINYLGKIEVGQPVLARGRIVRSGKRIAKEQGYRTKKTRQPVRETGCLAWFDEGEFSVSALCSGNYWLTGVKSTRRLRFPRRITSLWFNPATFDCIPFT